MKHEVMEKNPNTEPNMRRAPAGIAPDLGEYAFLLDIDGTLLELAPTPREVVVPPRLADTLQSLHERTSGALAIALFYAIGTGIGGVAGPSLFGALIDTGSRSSVFAGYLLGSALMIGAAIIAWRYCYDAECKSLESIARPLAAQE